MTPAPPPTREPARPVGRAPALALLAVLALLAGLLPLACSEERRAAPPPAPQGPPRTAVLDVAGRQVTVELAYTAQARARGLMHRSSLEPDHGMLFLFTDSDWRTFWMRNTLIPLDIVFLDEEGVVLNVEQGTPGVERPGFHSAGRARYVLEMTAGWCEEAGFGPGDRLEVAPELARLAEPGS